MPALPPSAESLPATTPASRHTVLSKSQRWCIVALIAAADWFSTLSSFIYYPVLSILAKDLHTSIARINFTVTSYLTVSGIAPSIAGDAADMFGRRPVYVVTLSLYFCANVEIALQGSFVALLLLRMLQSAGNSLGPSRSKLWTRMILRAEPSMTNCQMQTQSCYIQEDIVLESELLAVSCPTVDASTEADLKCQATSIEMAAGSEPKRIDRIPVHFDLPPQLIGFGIDSQLLSGLHVAPWRSRSLQCSAKSTRSGCTFTYKRKCAIVWVR